jgi:hypothetical protein
VFGSVSFVVGVCSAVLTSARVHSFLDDRGREAQLP